MFKSLLNISLLLVLIPYQNLCLMNKTIKMIFLMESLVGKHLKIINLIIILDMVILELLLLYLMLVMWLPKLWFKIENKIFSNKNQLKFKILNQLVNPNLTFHNLLELNKYLLNKIRKELWTNKDKIKLFKDYCISLNILLIKMNKRLGL